MFTSIYLLKLSHGLLLSHNVLCTSYYYIIKEKEIKYSAITDLLAYLLFYYNTLLIAFSIFLFCSSIFQMLIKTGT